MLMWYFHGFVLYVGALWSLGYLVIMMLNEINVYHLLSIINYNG